VCSIDCDMYTEVMYVLLSFLPGAIELSVFSEHYKVELDVVDIQTQRIDRFGTQDMSANLILTFYVFVHRHPLMITLQVNAEHCGASVSKLHAF